LISKLVLPLMLLVRWQEGHLAC